MKQYVMLLGFMSFLSCGINISEIISLRHSKNVSYFSDSIKVSCDGRKENLMLYYKYGINNIFLPNSKLSLQLKCIHQEILKGNNNSTDEIINIFEHIKIINPFLSDSVNQINNINLGYEFGVVTDTILNLPWRGERVFEKLLDVGNVHGCYIKNAPNCEVASGCIETVSVHYHFYNAYTKMIKTIDGLPFQKYIEIAVPYTPDRARQDDVDKCQQSLYRDYYTFIKKAYVEGRIVLKQYGEK